MPKTLLVFIDWFDPGYKAGGPIRSAVNFVKYLQEDYSIYVFTGDRDLGAAAPYPGVTLNEWVTYDARVKVFYCPAGALSRQRIKDLLSELRPDVIYLNSMFSKFFTIYPLLVAKGMSSRIVLAPRGMLRQSALQFKRAKKRVYLQAFKLFGFHKRVVFQATDDTEFKDVKKVFGTSVACLLVPNLPGYIAPYAGSITKSTGALKIIFTGRIHPIKNLDVLIRSIAGVKGRVELTVVGGEEDKVYAAYCRDLVRQLPETITVNFRGEVSNDKVPAVTAEHHIFGLPTQGENFGHAIFEALALGKPVLISDQTPWRNLSAMHAGWDLSLQEPSLFTEALQRVTDWDQATYDQWSKGAWQFVWDTVHQKDLKPIYHKLFNGDVHTWD